MTAESGSNQGTDDGKHCEGLLEALPSSRDQERDFLSITCLILCIFGSLDVFLLRSYNTLPQGASELRTKVRTASALLSSRPVLRTSRTYSLKLSRRRCCLKKQESVRAVSFLRTCAHDISFRKSRRSSILDYNRFILCPLHTCLYALIRMANICVRGWRSCERKRKADLKFFHCNWPLNLPKRRRQQRTSLKQKERVVMSF